MLKSGSDGPFHVVYFATHVHKKPDMKTCPQKHLAGQRSDYITVLVGRETVTSICKTFPPPICELTFGN